MASVQPDRRCRTKKGAFFRALTLNLGDSYSGDGFVNENQVDPLSDGTTKYRPTPAYRKMLHNRIVQSVVACILVGLLLYASYVARYHPDPQGTIVLGQTSVFTDSDAALRILVRDCTNSLPITGAQVRLTIEGRGISRQLGKFVTGQDGSVSDAVHIPDIPPGTYNLIIDSQSRIGKDHIVRPITVKRDYQVYLTTDKPVYQPGQTVHMRALVLDRMSLKPSVNHPIQFEVLDAKGNKVFKSNLTCSRYGLASCDFKLAREVNLGPYQIWVNADDVRSTKTVTVARYVLPKFKIDVATDKPFYLPSETISGSIKAHYFFGKPVVNAHIEVTGRTVFESPTDIFKITGTTNTTGQFTFSQDLSSSFVGRSLVSKNASLDIQVTVKDSTGHEEITVAQRPVAQEAINIHVFPEGSELIRGVENILYVLTAYPNGQPAICELDINGQIHTSDETGIAVFKTRVDTPFLSLRIKATDRAGQTGALDDRERLWARDGLLLRTDKAVYKVGETLRAIVLSTVRTDTVFVDVIRNGQTVLTQTLSVHDGQAELAVDLPQDLCGTLKVNAYAILSESKTMMDAYDGLSESKAVMDSRLVHVRRTNELQIETSLDKTSHKPGETATLDLKVTDNDGTPTVAALSLAAVDEAVFYVCENRPGLMEQFFYADKVLLWPAYQIAFAVSPTKLLSGQEKYQNLARVLFSAEAQATDWSELMWMPDADEDPAYWSTAAYEAYRRADYTLQAESNSEKLTQARVFWHRHVKVPLFVLLILGTLAVPLIMLIYLAHSIFGLLNVMTSEAMTEQATTQSSGTKHVYLFAVLALFPIVAYLTALVVQGLQGHDYGDFFDNGLHYVGVLVVALPAVAIVMFPRVLHFAPGLSRRSNKLRVQGLVFALIFGALVLLVLHYVVRATMKEVADTFVSLAVVSSFLLTFVLCLAASTTARKMSGKFYASLGKIGRFIMIVAIAETVVLHVWVLPVPLHLMTRSIKKTFRSPIPRFFSNRRFAGYGGMGGYGGYGTAMSGMGHLQPEAPPRIREYFPETLLWQPELITDQRGRARLNVPLADSITAWKMNIDAVSSTGQLGSSEVDIPVFQEFFVDVDLPVALTRNDEVSVPVMCYNYLQQPQTIQLALQRASWCEVQGPSSQRVELAPNDVKSVMFLIKALTVGTHELVVSAQGASISDAVQHSIDVHPDGVEVLDLQSGVLSQSADHSFYVPPASIPNSQKLLLNLYPSTFSEVIEGLESIFHMPYGCFEQTSSVTYPNVMALLYMKRTGQITPEIEAKAREFIAAGYQRLLTFEVDEGGFDWFGRPPAKEKLTAYGILQLTDMSKVHNVDPAVVERASCWLLASQNPDGSWLDSHDSWTQKNDQAHLADTAYITWALSEAGIRGRKLDNALAFLHQCVGEKNEPYVVALAANAFLANDPNDPFGIQLTERLSSQFQIQGNSAYIRSSGVGAMNSRGRCLDIETTALSAVAIMRVNPYADTVRKALTWLYEQKDRYGTWHSTQATVLAMKALTAGTNVAASGGESTTIEVVVNEQPALSMSLSAEQRDLLHTFDLTTYLRQGQNSIKLAQNRADALPYRFVGSYWVPQTTTKALSPKELEIQVDYDRERLAVDEILRCGVQITKRSDVPLNMAIIDLGIPPGFKVDPSAFKQLVASGVLARYELTANQCILYVRALGREEPLRFTYELKALYPVRAQTPSSSIYEYYQPENRDRTSLGAVVEIGPSLKKG